MLPSTVPHKHKKTHFPRLKLSKSFSLHVPLHSSQNFSILSRALSLYLFVLLKPYSRMSSLAFSISATDGSTKRLIQNVPPPFARLNSQTVRPPARNQNIITPIILLPPLNQVIVHLNAQSDLSKAWKHLNIIAKVEKQQKLRSRKDIQSEWSPTWMTSMQLWPAIDDGHKDIKFKCYPATRQRQATRQRLNSKSKVFSGKLLINSSYIALTNMELTRSYQTEEGEISAV